MAYYPDLSALPDSRILMVGWLSAGQPFALGGVEPAVVAKLVELLSNPWQPAVTPGVHVCEFCRFSGGPASFTYDGTTVHVGTADLYVPGRACLYLAPSLIVHYLDAHEYSPPAEFCEAVMDCPPMRSIAYFRRLLSCGRGGLLHRGRGP